MHRRFGITLSVAVRVLPILIVVLAYPDPGRAAEEGRPRLTRNVILVTLDGLRVQELFGGMDATIADKPKRSGIYDPERARKLYWRDTPEQRRAALMPFLWGTLAPDGMILGNHDRGSRVTPRNPLLFSYPGYAEILTGQYQPSITSNDLVRSPAETVLEFARRRLGLGRMEVAVIGSWDGFGYAAARSPDAFYMNTGYQEVDPETATPDMLQLSALQHQVMTLWETGRSDAVTMGLALDYMERHRPRLLYIALDETDDWAHARRYDRLLDDIHVIDGFLRRLWEAIGTLDAYRGCTTLIITTDHGRGRTPRDWVEHDTGIPGSEDIWLAVAGPDTPARGEAVPPGTVHQADIAATLLRFLGVDFRDWNPQAGPPIEAVFRKEPHP
jgi:hypothetical protein